MCILDHGLSVLGQGSCEVGGDFAARIHPLHLLTISSDIGVYTRHKNVRMHKTLHSIYLWVTCVEIVKNSFLKSFGYYDSLTV